MQPSHHPILGWDANLSLWEILILIRFFLGYWLGVFWWIYTWLTLHSDINPYCLFLSPSITCDANIFSRIFPVTTGDVQLFGVRKFNLRFFPSYLRFRKTRGITTQKQRSWRINCYILWHFCKLDRNWVRREKQQNFHTITEWNLVQNYLLQTL